MTNLFRAIANSRRFHEDLATDALHYLLEETPPEFRRQLRSAFTGLLAPVFTGRSCPDPDRYSVRKQGPRSGGRPDLLGLSGHAVVLMVENKFNLNLTRAQLKLSYLNDLSENGLLLFVVPDRNRHDFEAKIAGCMESSNAKWMTSYEGLRWCTYKHRWIGVTGWGILINVMQNRVHDLEDMRSIQIRGELEDLRWFCNRRKAVDFFRMFTNEEVSHVETAEFVLSLTTLVDMVLRAASDRKLIVNLGRYRGDDPSYGSEIDFQINIGDARLTAWFGFYPDAWRKDPRSPLWLQFYGKIVDLIDGPLAGFGYVNPELSEEWLGPIFLQAGIPMDRVVENVVYQLTAVKTAFKAQ